jgi:hypothetical protein
MTYGVVRAFQVIVNTLEFCPEKAAFYHLPVKQDDDEGVWNEGNTGAGSITVRSF